MLGRISVRFVVALVSGIAVVAANPKSAEAWATGLGIVAAGLSGGPVKKDDTGR